MRYGPGCRTGLTGHKALSRATTTLSHRGGQVHDDVTSSGLARMARPGQPGVSLGPGPRRADARDLVRGDLLAVARAADHDAKAARVADHAVCRAHDVWRVVVILDIRFGTAVHRLMAGRRQPLDQA